MVISAISSTKGDLTSYRNVIEDICAVASGFQLVEFHYVPRMCNTVADALAKKASTVTDIQVWLEVCPTDIIPLVLRDFSNVRNDP